VGRVDAQGSVAFGIQLPIQAQSTAFAEAWEAGAGVDELGSVARVAEHAGFAYVAVCDHVAIPEPRAAAMSTTWFDCVATLSYLAALTHRVRLVSHIYVLPYRHPLVVAKQWATLDALSGGRAILGVGAGHVEGEFDALGLDFHRRGALLDEAIDAVRAALAGEFSAHAGDVWAYDEVGVGPRPVQHRVPIWVGGSSPAALRRAAERGDGWLPQGTPRAEMPASIAYLLEHRTKTIGEEPIDLGAITEVFYVGDATWDVGARTTTGSPELLATRINEFGAMGVSHVQVRFRSRDLQEQLDQIAAFGAEVLPLLTR
jgi:probable F420-dependent oxidoreductase